MNAGNVLKKKIPMMKPSTPSLPNSEGVTTEQSAAGKPALPKTGVKQNVQTEVASKADVPSQSHPVPPKSRPKTAGAGSGGIRRVQESPKPSEAERVQGISDEKEAEPKTKRGAERPGEEASELAFSGEFPAEAHKPRFTHSRAERREYEGQVTMIAMRTMSFTERHELWKRLNADADEFVTILKPDELPRRVMREDKAGNPPNKEALFCCYCGDWMKFRLYSYTGYTKCISCGISTRDFHICMANGLWNKD